MSPPFPINNYGGPIEVRSYPRGWEAVKHGAFLGVGLTLGVVCAFAWIVAVVKFVRWF